MLLYNPVTKHTIVRRTFRVLGPVRQGETQLTYEAAYDDTQQISHFNNQLHTAQPIPPNNVIRITETGQDNLRECQDHECPELLGDDSDSDSDEVEIQSVNQK